MGNNAQIFKAFDALNGFRKLLEEGERWKEERRFLSEDDANAINQELVKLKKGNIVKITYYHIDSYHSIQGRITMVDEVYKTIKIGKNIIKITDIISIEIKGE